MSTWLVINIETLIEDAEVQKVRFQSGKLFSQHGNHVSAIRMSFANLNNEEITLGLHRLKNAFLNQHSKLSQPRLMTTWAHIKLNGYLKIGCKVGGYIQPIWLIWDYIE